MARRTDDDTLHNKINEAVQRMPGYGRNLPAQLLDKIHRNAVREDMRCLMVFNIYMALRKKNPRVVLEELGDRAGLRSMFDEAIWGIENATFGASTDTWDSEAPKSTLYINMFSNTCG